MNAAPVPDDPFAGRTIASFANALRNGEVSAEATAAACLSRIVALDGSLGAFEEVSADAALGEARAIDRRVAAGEDLGPLMGVPIAVKDIFAVAGTRIHAGSSMRVDDLVGPEGSFVRRLRALGCIVLGKTKTTEFAFSPSGINSVRGTPRNPRDDTDHRIPGGSSSGSAVAVGAGYCPLSIGSDTGGSIRVPAALTGIVGLKTSVGLWKTDGVFSLSTTFDSIGLFARSIDDAALAFRTVEACAPAERRPVAALRLGLPEGYFSEDLDPEVERAFDAFTIRLRKAGATLTPISLPEAAERAPLIGRVLAYELVKSAGKERMAAALPEMDGLVRQRVEAGFAITAAEHADLVERHRVVERIVTARVQGLDGWISPAVPMVAPTLASCGDAGSQAPLNLRLTRNTQPGNLFGACGVSMPLLTPGLPVGLQLLAPRGRDAETLAVAASIERFAAGDD